VVCFCGSITNAWFLTLNIPPTVVFEHNKFHAICGGATQPLIQDKWNIVVLITKIRNTFYLSALPLFTPNFGFLHVGQVPWPTDKRSVSFRIAKTNSPVYYFYNDY